MQDVSYYELSIEYYDLTKKIEQLMKAHYGVDVKLSCGIEQIIGASVPELATCLKAVESRFATYFEDLELDEVILSKITALQFHIQKFHLREFDNSVFVTPERRALVRSILRIFEAMSHTGARPGLARLYSYDTQKLRDIHSTIEEFVSIYHPQK